MLSINRCDKRNASILPERTLGLVSKYLIFNCMVVLVWRWEKKYHEEVEGRREREKKRIKLEK